MFKKLILIDSEKKIHDGKAKKAQRLAHEQEIEKMKTHIWVTSADGKTKTLKKK